MPHIRAVLHTGDLVFDAEGSCFVVDVLAGLALRHDFRPLALV